MLTNDFVSQMNQLRGQATQNADRSISAAYDKLINTGKREPPKQRLILDHTRDTVARGGDIRTVFSRFGIQVEQAVETVIHEVEEVADDAADGIEGFVEDVVEGVENVINDIGDFFDDLF